MDPGDAGYDADNLYRNSLAEYWLPDVDEWYKAAYYDPDTETYFEYPTGSNTEPTSVPGGTGEGTAVFGQDFGTGPADVDNAGGPSPYGVMGLGGNVWEWEETATDLLNDSTTENRAYRGGSWSNSVGNLRPTTRLSEDPSVGVFLTGLRVAGAVPVATIPEPSTFLAMWLLGGFAMLIRKRRRVAVT